MKKLFKWFAPGVVAASLFFYANQSAAAISTPSIAVYTFTGDCSDCVNVNQQFGNEVFATLTLKNYLPDSGGIVNYGNFLSFAYSGSDLMSAFTITPDNKNSFVEFGADVFADNAAPRDFTISGDVANFYNKETEETGEFSIFFTSSSNGSWSLGYLVSCGGENSSLMCVPADLGGSHTYSLTSFTPATNPNDVPEPGSLLLVGAALVALGAARRRRA